jgi:hypothetical protein
VVSLLPISSVSKGLTPNANEEKLSATNQQKYSVKYY